MGSAQAAPASFHRPIARYYFEQHLAPALRARPQQQLRPFDEWERHAWYDDGERYWWQAEVDGQPVGNLSSQREFVPGRLWHPTLPDGWFNHWFQSLRTALGMFRSGRDRGETPNQRYLYDDNAETAGCAVFLFRLHAVTSEAAYLDGAQRAMT